MVGDETGEPKGHRRSKETFTSDDLSKLTEAFASNSLGDSEPDPNTPRSTKRPSDVSKIASQKPVKRARFTKTIEEGREGSNPDELTP